MTKNMMKGGAPTLAPIASPVVGPAFKPSGVADGFSVKHSMHLTDGPYITNTPSVSNEVNKYTLATWVKLDSSMPLTSNPLSVLGVTGSATEWETFFFVPADSEFHYTKLRVTNKGALVYTTTRDNSDGWFHICLRMDLDLVTAVLEIDGVVSGVSTIIALANTAFGVGKNQAHYIGSADISGLFPIECFLADTHLVVGETYDSSYFIDAELKAIEFTEDHGVNGAHFTYDNASNLGENNVGDNWTDVNSPSQSTDVPL